MDETIKVLARAVELYYSGSDDPEDTLMLQLTQKEVMMVTIGLILMTGSGVSPIPVKAIYALNDKIMECMDEQKDTK